MMVSIILIIKDSHKLTEGIENLNIKYVMEPETNHIYLLANTNDFYL